MVEVMQSFDDSNIKDVFDAFPDEVRPTLLAVRELIFNVAANNDDIGALSERLRWGQVSYLTKQTKSGSTVRIDALSRHKIAIYFICTSNLVEEFRRHYGDLLTFSKNRAIHLDPDKALPTNAIKHCIELALTYRLRKKINRANPT